MTVFQILQVKPGYILNPIQLLKTSPKGRTITEGSVKYVWSLKAILRCETKKRLQIMRVKPKPISILTSLAQENSAPTLAYSCTPFVTTEGFNLYIKLHIFHEKSSKVLTLTLRFLLFLPTRWSKKYPSIWAILARSSSTMKALLMLSLRYASMRSSSLACTGTHNTIETGQKI